jgi:Protein of unknown function (DUF2283).
MGDDLSCERRSRPPRHSDILTVILKEGVAVAESDEGRPGVILDFDDDGNLLSLEVLDASRRVTEAKSVDFQLTE